MIITATPATSTPRFANIAEMYVPTAGTVAKVPASAVSTSADTSTRTCWSPITKIPTTSPATSRMVATCGIATNAPTTATATPTIPTIFSIFISYPPHLLMLLFTGASVPCIDARHGRTMSGGKRIRTCSPHVQLPRHPEAIRDPREQLAEAVVIQRHEDLAARGQPIDQYAHAFLRRALHVQRGGGREFEGALDGA